MAHFRSKPLPPREGFLEPAGSLAMTPPLRACLATAALAALAGASPGRELVRIVRPPPPAAPSASVSAAPGPRAVPCPPGALPDGEVCVPFDQGHR